jgi:two-component system LytT family response regulator
MQINAMITEDDLLSRTMLCDLLEDYFPDVRIVGMAQTVKESVEFLKNHKIDLLFLDIELPDGKGPDILKSLQNVDFTVIITTSFLKYAEELNSADILYSIIKPLTHDSLDKAMKCFSEKKSNQVIPNHINPIIL